MMTETTAASRLESALRLLATDPMEAARRLEALGDQMYALAAQIREKAAGHMRSPGGFGDRVQATVVGPGGVVKQSIDTDQVPDDGRRTV